VPGIRALGGGERRYLRLSGKKKEEGAFPLSAGKEDERRITPKHEEKKGPLEMMYRKRKGKQEKDGPAFR